MLKALTITPTPFRSSLLAMDPSAFSPQFPVTPPIIPPRSLSSTSRKTTPLVCTPPPKDPLPWLWQCHFCNRTYKLGVTRRCLDDGHRFCSGVTVLSHRDKQSRVRRHKACASEFDYQGWSNWGEWRRQVQEINELENAAMEACVSPLFGRSMELESVSEFGFSSPQSIEVKKDCWNDCGYPSECRWGKKIALPSTSSSGSGSQSSIGTHATTGNNVDTSATQTDSIRSTSEQAMRSSTEPADSSIETVLTETDNQSAMTNDPIAIDSEAQSTLTKVLDDFEAEMKKSLSRANDILIAALDGWRSSSPSPVRSEERKERSQSRSRS